MMFGQQKKNGSAVFVALDWAKAFDCISPDGLVDALRRFGLPRRFLEFIQNIYHHRQLFCGRYETKVGIPCTVPWDIARLPAESIFVCNLDDCYHA